MERGLHRFGTFRQTVDNVFSFRIVALLRFDVVINGSVRHYRIGTGSHYPWAILRRIAAVVIGYQLPRPVASTGRDGSLFQHRAVHRLCFPIRGYR